MVDVFVSTSGVYMNLNIIITKMYANGGRRLGARVQTRQNGLRGMSRVHSEYVREMRNVCVNYNRDYVTSFSQKCSILFYRIERLDLIILILGISMLMLLLLLLLLFFAFSSSSILLLLVYATRNNFILQPKLMPMATTLCSRNFSEIVLKLSKC